MSKLLRIDHDVWSSLIERRAKLEIRFGRILSMNDVVRDLMFEILAEEALAPWPEAERETETEEETNAG
jgi:hypothetical protein